MHFDANTNRLPSQSTIIFFFQGCLKMLYANEILEICNKLGTWILELDKIEEIAANLFEMKSAFAMLLFLNISKWQK